MSWPKRSVQGSSARTESAVVRTSARKLDTSLLLPLSTDLATPEGLRIINERFDQIERMLRASDEYEVSLAVKFGYGSLGSVTATAQPVPGAKLTLDKIGTWLILASFDWTSANGSEGFVVIDPETAAGAKRQDAWCRATGSVTLTAWCLFTANSVPRLAQMYAKGAGALQEAGTSICAIWLGRWEPGLKTFGRQMESAQTGPTDMNGDTLTDHGEQGRWPKSDHPDYLAEGVNLPAL